MTFRYTDGERGVDAKRCLLVTADDFGIGPATSQGILDLAARGRLTGTVLLVNSPYAESAVRAWRQAGRPIEVGWHPCLTLDRPVLPPQAVPSLVGPDGRFHPLGRFLRRLALGRVRRAEIRSELRAQYGRFHDLVGHRPRLVNSHHHVQVFPPVGRVLAEVLGLRPAYVRRIRESWRALRGVPGARLKRLVLSALGRRDARIHERAGSVGNAQLAGITNPPWVADPAFLTRWLACVPGPVVELTCHPGHWDETLLGRDCTARDGQLERRVREWHLLAQPDFVDAYRKAGFTLTAAAALIGRDPAPQPSAA